MKRGLYPGSALIAAVLMLLSMSSASAQTDLITHQLEGKLQNRNTVVPLVRVRLVRRDSLEPVGETFSRSDGSFVFSRVTDGDYLLETFETDQYEATSTDVELRPRPRRSIFLRVNIEIPLKGKTTTKPGVITADIDVQVPKEAVKHYQAGTKALKDDNFVVAEKELRQAIELYQNYYAARLELGRELRVRKRFADGAEVLFPLLQLAPNRADPRVEYGACLLELKRPDEAALELRRAIELEETSWVSHLYLGWALLESAPPEAEIHFKRALDLNQRKAARAYLALARIADSQDDSELAIHYLETFLTLMPNATDADVARKLLARLRG